MLHVLSHGVKIKLSISDFTNGWGKQNLVVEKINITCVKLLTVGESLLIVFSLLTSIGGIMCYRLHN